MEIKGKNKKDIELIIWTMFNGMCYSFDYFGCEPCCRISEDHPEREYKCELCYKEFLKRHTYILDCSDLIYKKDGKYVKSPDKILNMEKFIDNLAKEGGE